MRLTTRTLQINDQMPSHISRQVSVVAKLDQGKGKDDAGGDAGRGEELSIGNVDRVWCDLYPTVNAREQSRVSPVCSRACRPAPHRREKENARADRHHTDSPVNKLSRPIT